MRDIHCHIMYGIDDGSKSLEQSLEILKNAYSNGITDIVLTPHYVNKTKYNCNNENKKIILEELKNKLKEENIDINLYIGNEVMIDPDITKLISNDEISTINNTKYVLVELPMHYENPNSEKMIFDLIRHGYIPVLAHPERYEYVQEDISKLDPFIEMGCVLQGNYLSLFGKYGDNSKKLLKILLKEKKIKLLASDIHRPSTDYRIKKLKKKLKWFLKDKKYIEDLLENNFLSIINDKIIEND